MSLYDKYQAVIIRMAVRASETYDQTRDLQIPLDVSIDTIRRYASNKCDNPTLRTIYAIAKINGLTVSAMLALPGDQLSGVDGLSEDMMTLSIDLASHADETKRLEREALRLASIVANLLVDPEDPQ